MGRHSAAIGSILFLGLAAQGCVFSNIPQLELPEDLKQSGPPFGETHLAKAPFIEKPGVGFITDIRYGKFNKSSEPALVIVGQSGAVFLQKELQPTKAVSFGGSPMERVSLVSLDTDAAPWFLGVNRLAVTLFDGEGAARWSYTSLWGIDDVAAGDVSGDGVVEFAVGLNGFGGVRLLDANGRKLWARYKDGNIWRVAILPGRRGAPGKVLHTEAGGELVVRTETGDELGRYRPTGSYISQFSPTRWRDESQLQYFVTAGDGYIFIFDSDGHLTKRLEAPHCHSLGHAIGTPVHFSNAASYYATLVNYHLWNRAAFLLHDLTGKLAFQEVIMQPCSALGTVPVGDGDKLLVGCGQNVWEYSLGQAHRNRQSARGKQP